MRYAPLWHAITSFGDSALLLPLMAWMAIVLALAPQRRDAFRWVAAAMACGGIVALSKLVFMAWDIGPPGLDYTGFSGHTALSVLTWPSLAALLTPRARPPVSRIAIALGALLGMMVGMSRLALEVHSVSEVIMGAMLGAAVATWFIRGMRHDAGVPPWQTVILGLGAVVIVCVFYGRVFPSQHLLRDIAVWLSGHPNVFTRHGART